MKKYVWILGLVLLVSCKSGQDAVTQRNSEATKSLVENGDYEIQLAWARPLMTNELAQLGNSNLLPFESRAGRINLIGSASYVKKKGDSLEVYLPYYGTRQMAPKVGGYNDAAIEFKGVPEDYTVEYNERKNRTEVNFKMKEGTEKYNVNMTITGSKRATVRVYSTQRTSISYTGELGPNSGD
ncbi:MAG: DUF4251 domain-containing protein [Bacteroidota bacterium]